ncbi:MAG: hypothetical protein PVJ64_04745 [Gemmatimonadales bacterium]|jgi:hypothetical protein
MKPLLRLAAIALVAGLSTAVPLSGSAPDSPTLLFENDGTRTLRILVDDLYVGTVGMNRLVCLQMPFRPGMATLEARTPDSRVSVFSEPIPLSQSEGWYWKIGSKPEQDAKLTLRPVERCEVR